MTTQEIQKTVGRILGFGVPLTSLFLITSGVSDPVNVTKMTVAGGVGIAGLLLFIVFGFKENRVKFRSTLFISVLFLLAGLNAVILSNAPLAQNLYGAYGRNTGLLTYVFMVGVLLCALMMETEKNFTTLVYGLVVTGIVNVIYCAWVLAFGDFIVWSNPYGNILGLFGNPNFISAFLGMFITTSIALAFKSDMRAWKRFSLIFLSFLAFFEILQSHAIQGLVVTLGGLTIIGFYFVYAKSSSWVIPSFYLGTATVIGILAVLGTLQKGPLTFVYKRSVSLRGSYWHAGIDMGLQNPFHGVGFDTYGDWYRRSRPPVALVDMPGVNIMSNASHNVVIDFFASGGWPLLLSYIAILILAIRSILKVTQKVRTFDPIFVALAATWMCYQVQSLISINQVGLTVWGWALTGALISYEQLVFSGNIPSLTEKKTSRNVQINAGSPISPGLVAAVGVAIGLFVAAPAINSEITWQGATQSRNLDNIQKALIPSFMNPASSFKYAQAVNLLQNSNLSDLAHDYALTATRYNPDYFDAWKQLYYIQNVTTEEKEAALENMTRLDPQNPDVTQLR
ncbi:O-antigen ligase family protein [Candidatus Planktophila dulcis]|uniref:O-antigen ligase family protein n=1 Tax=Candidatus Planktophila dulcis TaxID=1884914 RepID=UPI003BEF0C17